MDKGEIRNRAKVMLAFADGKEIERQERRYLYSDSPNSWIVDKDPTWDWQSNFYRVAIPRPPNIIDVLREFKRLANLYNLPLTSLPPFAITEAQLRDAGLERMRPEAYEPLTILGFRCVMVCGDD